MVARSRSPLPFRSASVPLIGLLLMIGLGAAACAELAAPPAYSPTTSSTVPTDIAAEGEPVASAPTEVDQTVPEFVPTAEPGFIPFLLVAGNRSVFAVDGLDSTPLTGTLANLQATRVYDDLGGGVVYQQPNGAVVYRPSQGEAVELLDPGSSTLLGVGYWGASPRAFVKSAPGRVDWIQLVTEEAGRVEQRTHFELAEGEEIVAFSANRDIQAVVVQDEDCGEIRFYDSDGQRMTFSSPPPPPCTFPGRPSFGSVALSPDGGAVAYTVVTWRDDGTEQVTDLAGRDLLTEGDAFVARRVGENLDTIDSLTYDGERVGLIRSSGGAESVILLDLTDSSIDLRVDLLGASDVHAVSFSRVPLDIVT